MTSSEHRIDTDLFFHLSQAKLSVMNDFSSELTSLTIVTDILNCSVIGGFVCGSGTVLISVPCELLPKAVQHKDVILSSFKEYHNLIKDIKFFSVSED